MGGAGIGLLECLAAVPSRARQRGGRRGLSPDPEPFVFVGNNEYQLEGVRIGARARLDGGLLHVSMAPGLGRPEMLYVLGRALAGRSTDDRLDTFSAPEFAIDARR